MRRLAFILGVLVAIVVLGPSSLFAQATTPPPPQTPATVRVTPPPTATSAPSHLKGFTVTLVLGDTEAGASDPRLNEQATKALADLKDFLPYKRYTLLDTAPIIGLNVPNFTLRAGVQKYEFGMHCISVSPTTTYVDQLRLWEMADIGEASRKTNFNLLIDTAFKIDVGETVVVGTSRLDGGKALILLVSAVR